jgi:hypothetical protein
VRRTIFTGQKNGLPEKIPPVAFRKSPGRSKVGRIGAKHKKTRQP